MPSSRADAGNEGADSGGQRPRRPHRPHQEAQPVCPICQGMGYVMLDVDTGHPDFGRPRPCVCKHAEIAARQTGLMQKFGSLGPLARLTFDEFDAEPFWLPQEKARNLRSAYDSCQAFAAGPKGWLLLTGTFGCGKTHLAAGIANARLAQQKPALFLVVADLLDHLRATICPAARSNTMISSSRCAPPRC